MSENLYGSWQAGGMACRVVWHSARLLGGVLLIGALVAL